jgi:hypothetical protein
MIPRDLRLTFRPMAVLSPSSVRPESVTGPSCTRHRSVLSPSPARPESVTGPSFSRHRLVGLQSLCFAVIGSRYQNIDRSFTTSPGIVNFSVVRSGGRHELFAAG